MQLRLLLLALVLVLGLAACGGDDEPAADDSPTVAETGGVTTGDDGDDGDTGDDDGNGDDDGDAEAGAQVFAQAGCGGCHVLEAAGSTGTVGPNLDESEPDFDLVVDRETNGRGAMPSFKEQLSEQEIRDVAEYVSESADD